MSKQAIVAKRMIKQVIIAKPYLPGFGAAEHVSQMYIRQYKFPFSFIEGIDDHLISNSDKLSLHNFKHAQSCYHMHTGAGICNLDGWVIESTDEAIMKFMKDILRADEGVQWTGYRVMVSIRQDSGYPMWIFELFAKHPDSDTVVFTGPYAPNIGQ